MWLISIHANIMHFRIAFLTLEHHLPKVSACMHANDHVKWHLRSASSAQEERLQTSVVAKSWMKRKVDEHRKEQKGSGSITGRMGATSYDATTVVQLQSVIL